MTYVDEFSLDSNAIFDIVASLFLDKLDLEFVFFIEDDQT